jgi:ketosteroid isomerase-like protein
MKKVFIALFLCVVFPLMAWAQKSPMDERTSAVLKAIREWDTAYITHDQYAVKRLLAEDYIGIDHDGEVTKKADEVALVKSGEYVLLSVEQIEPRQVRFYGSTAIVTSYSNVNLKIKGAVTNFMGRATTVCTEKKVGQWEIVSWHASKVKESE